MRYYVFNSGSKGNCTLLIADNHYLLIDMGITKKKLIEKLAETGVPFEKLEYVLFTHRHTDHLSGLDYFDKEKIYANSATCEVLKDHELIPYNTYKINDFRITVIPTSHDVEGSIGFIIEYGEEKLVYITDTGYLYQKVLPLIKNADYYIFESNHNVKMLMKTDRPQRLKQRILGDYGHLSNEDSALYLTRALGEKTKEIVLAHLSEEANSPDVALETFTRIAKEFGISLDNISIRCASQHDTISGGSFVEVSLK